MWEDSVPFREVEVGGEVVTVLLLALLMTTGAGSVWRAQRASRAKEVSRRGKVSQRMSEWADGPIGRTGWRPSKASVNYVSSSFSATQ